jgi:tRNA threonylcarbamoyladenosine biosynthesis protein TsaB
MPRAVLGRLRVLGIETSSVRGSVALVEGHRAIASASHDVANAHDAFLQPLIERLLAEAGWSPRQLDRIAVGIGPGSFTGLRVGIAFAHGLSEGLQIPLVGVSSLQAMAGGVSEQERRLRVPLLDARRGEFFVAAYAPDGGELLPAQIARDAGAVEQLVAELPAAVLLLGVAWDPLSSKLPHQRDEQTDLPHARWVAQIATQREPSDVPRPLYLRPPVASVPQLEPSPLSAEGRAAIGLSASEGARASGADHGQRQG